MDLLALEGLKGYQVRPGTVFYGFDVFSLLSGFPDHVNTRDQGAGEVKQDCLNGLRGISGKKGRGKRG